MFTFPFQGNVEGVEKTIEPKTTLLSSEPEKASMLTALTLA